EESTLFLNNGDGTFKDITSSSGIGKINCMAAAALDYNDDGYLDIVWSSGVLSNNKNNTFTPLPLTAIGIPPSYGIDVGQIISFDYNNDGFPDLLFISYSNGVKLMHNNGDSAFADVTEAAGLTGLAPYMAGVAAGDYDNDGYFDIFLSGERGDALYKNNGNGTFTDITKEAINIETGVGGMWWGTAFFDYDNDGYLDLYLTTGGLGTNMLYRNNRDGTFTDVTDSMFPEGIAPNWAAAAIGDINNDGALDIYAPGSSFTGSTGGLLMNQVGLQNNWIKVKLEGVRCNKEAIGARVYVRTGGLTQIREVNTSPVETQPVHFGLGQASVIDEIEVIWPDGNVQKINDITPSQILTITEIVNKPPVFDPVRFKYGSTTIDEGTVVWFFITASDPDGDPLTYSASNLPDGAKFQPPWSPYWTIRTPNFYWCPLYDQAGVYPVVFTATDGKTEASEIVTITVNDVNTAPFLKVYAGKTITVKTGELLRLGLIAFDRQL
ncbi:MAG: FG-GAP-like repeat-containing protein, partial [Candidatus Omnitrophica bacterium]|nr:FG-GAP-like repeat-containing protein [Candidatus Omnitrophota bacterium]